MNRQQAIAQIEVVALVWSGKSLFRRSVEAATKLLIDDDADYVMDELNALKARLLRTVGADDTLRECSQGTVGGKLCRSFRGFRSLVVRQVWLREGRRVSSLAKCCPCRPRKCAAYQKHVDSSLDESSQRTWPVNVPYVMSETTRREMKLAAEFDIVVHGATGFTGQLVAEYLLERYGCGHDLRWAISGRNLGKLEAVRDSLGTGPELPILVCSPDDVASVKRMVAFAKVVISAAGPYQVCGEPVVEACALSGTDYVDINGEVAWMRHMIDRYQQPAANSGARIVFSCGFDSIPSDLGVLRLQQLAMEQHGSGLVRAKGRVRSMRGGVSGGTIATLNLQKSLPRDSEELALLVDPFALTPGFLGRSEKFDPGPTLDADLHVWTVPFVMATINGANVHRSNLLLGHPYGQHFAYDERESTGPGNNGREAAEAKIEAGKNPGPGPWPKPGEGPSEEARRNGSFDILYAGWTSSEQQVRVVVTGDRDPGYGSTSKMLAESALCLLQDDVPAGGGCWTPASAMGATLLGRLERNAGLKFLHDEM